MTLPRRTLSTTLAIALLTGAAGCMATPDLVFTDVESASNAADAATLPRPPGTPSDAADPSAPDRLGASDAIAYDGGAPGDSAVPSPTPPPPPPATCPSHVPSGADRCCGTVPCVGKKCVDFCGDCAGCAGRVCCVGNGQNNGNGNDHGNGVSCAATPMGCSN